MVILGQVLAAIMLSSYVAAWWLAIRIVFGRRFGVIVWLPTAYAAFCVPIMLADFAAVSRCGWSEGWLIRSWFAVALAIDGGWVTSLLWRRFKG